MALLLSTSLVFFFGSMCAFVFDWDRFYRMTHPWDLRPRSDGLLGERIWRSGTQALYLFSVVGLLISVPYYLLR
jgi:hypothetical protein